jgi:hypothetical protein
LSYDADARTLLGALGTDGESNAWNDTAWHGGG